MIFKRTERSATAEKWNIFDDEKTASIGFIFFHYDQQGTFNGNLNTMVTATLVLKDVRYHSEDNKEAVEHIADTAINMLGGLIDIFLEVISGDCSFAMDCTLE